ncbi:MAG: peptide-methionine (S)-S-oxide reductase MsrA [Hyphomicrobiaceae bacterium]
MRLNILRLFALVASVLWGLPASAQTPAPGLAVATFAGGCFWCMEPPYEKIDGVFTVYSGYMGGSVKNPTYEQVSRGGTGHTEVVQVTYDPAKVSYQKLLDIFWVNIDPVDKGGQFCDRGDMYRPEIFVHSLEQRQAAEASKAALNASKKLQWPVVVQITDAAAFTKAEDYHQKFHLKNPSHYNRYRAGCGRDARLEALWGKAAAKTQ